MELPETTKDITVGWLNEVLHENGLLGNAKIVSLAVEQIGVGRGLVSDIAKLNLDYDTKTANLPKTMIAKLPPSLPASQEFAMSNNIFEREIRFYLEVAPSSPIRTPKLLYGAVDSKNQRYVLLIEDLSSYTPADPELRGLSYEQTRIITLKIADFHVRWWNSQEARLFAWLPTRKDTMRRQAQRVMARWDDCCRMQYFMDALPSGGFDAGHKLMERFLWLAGDMPEDKLTIIHGDLKPDNMFFDPATPENPLILLDWSGTTVRARGVNDISYLLNSSVTTELRRQIEKDIVKTYYESLVTQGISDYSFSECWTDYLRGLLITTPSIVGVFSNAYNSGPVGARYVTTTLKRRFSAIVDNDATSILP